MESLIHHVLNSSDVFNI